MNLETLVQAFNVSFLPRWDTRLVGGFPEPLYQPSEDGRPAEIQFTRDYLSSALHEISHWCIAGPERRAQVDYGYWYRPDGRNPREQEEFFRMEAKPQSLEMAFSEKCGIDFRVSCDNLNGGMIHAEEFEKRVRLQLEAYRREGFPARAREFMALLDRLTSVDSPALTNGRLTNPL